MRKQLYFWAALIWSLIISYFCLAQFSSVPLGNVSNIDKFVHAFFHFVLTTFCFLFFKNQYKEVVSYKPLVFSFLFSLFFGIGIELAQGFFTTTRQADIFDVMANVSGACLSLLLITLFGFNNKTK
ncbi:VanZ family protein [Flavobacterium sp. I-SCBP12n]|uniref:VanZ family protein n=2 Tax=Flavobacterium TaxID=237 RepID=A0A9X1XSB0_9FLAO|nr:VanZ family protein [Flavobacterium flabelliforme]MBP4140762.1 VanZ family protein [Flavobacterium flabelliforme]MCK8142169.1 VanZ family protein [Flavobacterium pygoscelis]